MPGRDYSCLCGKEQGARTNSNSTAPIVPDKPVQPFTPGCDFQRARPCALGSFISLGHDRVGEVRGLYKDLFGRPPEPPDRGGPRVQR